MSDYNFTFNGVHCSTYGIIATKKSRPVLPATDDRYLEIPGRHGDHLFPGAFKDRDVVVECIVANVADLPGTMRNIAAWLYTGDRADLEFDDEPGKTYRAKVDGSIDADQVARTRQFKIKFRCEPFAYGTEQTADFVSDQVTVDNAGTFETLPTITATFTGSAAELKVALDASNYVRVVRNFVAGDELVINCNTGAVTVNGARALADLDWQYSKFFALPVGQSTLTITPAGVCTANIAWTPRWL